MVWYVCAKLVQMSALSIRRDGTRLLFLLLGIEKGDDDDSTQAGASAVHTIQTETRCGEDDDVAGLSWTWVNRAMFGRSQCDSVSLFGAGRGGVLQANKPDQTGREVEAGGGWGGRSSASQPASNQPTSKPRQHRHQRERGQA